MGGDVRGFLENERVELGGCYGDAAAEHHECLLGFVDRCREPPPDRFGAVGPLAKARRGLFGERLRGGENRGDGLAAGQDFGEDVHGEHR